MRAPKGGGGAQPQMAQPLTTGFGQKMDWPKLDWPKLTKQDSQKRIGQSRSQLRRGPGEGGSGRAGVPWRRGR